MKNGCANRRQSQTRLSYAEVKPVIDEVNKAAQPYNLEELGGGTAGCACQNEFKNLDGIQYDGFPIYFHRRCF